MEATQEKEGKETREAKHNEITVIFGKKGSGKSNLAKFLLYEGARGKSLFIWDFLGEYGSYGIVFDNTLSILQYLKTRKPPYKIILQSKRIDDFDNFCKVIYNIGNIYLLVEETDSVCNANKIYDSFAYIIRYGRHYNLDILAITRRPFDIARLLTANADKIYCFQYNEPRDLQYLRAFMPIDATEQIQTLKRYYYIHYNTITSEVNIDKAPLM